jgi:hypothetical protein
MLVPSTVEGFRLGSRHAMAERLAAADCAEPVAFVVAEFRTGKWLFGDDWSIWFETLDEARSFAAATPSPPYWVGVFAVVPVDGGRLFPPAVREDHCPV